MLLFTEQLNLPVDGPVLFVPVATRLYKVVVDKPEGTSYTFDVPFTVILFHVVPPSVLDCHWYVMTTWLSVLLASTLVNAAGSPPLQIV